MDSKKQESIKFFLSQRVSECLTGTTPARQRGKSIESLSITSPASSVYLDVFCHSNIRRGVTPPFLGVSMPYPLSVHLFLLHQTKNWTQEVFMAKHLHWNTVPSFSLYIHGLIDDSGLYQRGFWVKTITFSTCSECHRHSELQLWLGDKAFIWRKRFRFHPIGSYSYRCWCSESTEVQHPAGLQSL